MNWSTVGVKAVFRSGCGDSARIQWARLRSKRWATERGLHVGDATAKLKQLYPGRGVHRWRLLALQGLRRLRTGRRPDRHGPDEGRGGRLHPGLTPTRPSDAAGATRPGRLTPGCQRGPTASPSCPGPTFAAPYHLAGPADASRFNYGRYDNPTWARLEDALGELEGAQSVGLFAAGMAAVSAVVIPGLHTGDVLVAPSDAYPGIRAIARDVLAPNGVEVRLVATDDAAIRAALPGATLVWLESPSNPGLVVLDLPGLIAEAHARGAVVAVDNTLAGPLRQRPLELGADYSVMSASKHLGGHSDLIMGVVAVADDERAAALREWRIATGSIPGPFEAWLAHRSLATLGLRLERQEANARRSRTPCAPATTSATCAGRGWGPSSASTSDRTPAPTRSWRRASWWPRPRASAACTPAPSAARAGAATTSARASSASTPGSRTRLTSWPTSSARSSSADPEGGAPEQAGGLRAGAVVRARGARDGAPSGPWPP